MFAEASKVPEGEASVSAAAAAEEGEAQFPQPRHWRAVVKQAHQWQCGKVDSIPQSLRDSPLFPKGAG